MGECNHIINFDAEWVVNSATSYNCVPKKEYFSSYRAEIFGRVKMGNNSVANIVGLGDICIQTNLGYAVILKNVTYSIFALKFNLNECS